MRLNEINIISKQIVEAIIEDLSDRKGLQNEWDELDDETEKEIIEEWIKIVKKHIPVRVDNGGKSKQ